MTQLFTGFALAEQIQDQTRALLAPLGRAPVCATLLDPDNAAAAAYLARQQAMATAAGIRIRALPWARDPGSQLAALAADPAVDAVLPLAPLPPGLNADTAARILGPEKDVDGQHPQHAGALLLGQANPRLPATAQAALLCARTILGSLSGAEVVVVGASARIGRPLAVLLTEAGATVTLCHAATRDLAAHTTRADLIVTAAGVPGLIGRDHVARGGRVLDVAVIRTAQGLVGDADRAALTGHAALISAVPDGIGPVTTACLIANIARAALEAKHAP